MLFNNVGVGSPFPFSFYLFYNVSFAINSFPAFLFFRWQTVLLLAWVLLLFSLFRAKSWELFRCFSFFFSQFFLCSEKRELLIRSWSDIGGSGSARNPRAKTGNCNEPSKEAGGLCPGTGPKEAIFSFKLVRFYILHNCNQLISNHWYQILKFLVTQFEFLSDSVSAILTS